MSENEVIPPDVLVMSLGMFSWVTCKCVCVHQLMQSVSKCYMNIWRSQ